MNKTPNYWTIGTATAAIGVNLFAMTYLAFGSWGWVIGLVLTIGMLGLIAAEFWPDGRSHLSSQIRRKKRTSS